MITKKDLNEAAHEVACMQQGEIAQLRAELADSQSRECAMREVLQMCKDVEGTRSPSYDPEEFNAAIDEVLATPAPVGWVRLRWRSVTEVPITDGKVICDVGYKIELWSKYEGNWPTVKRWLYAEELKETQ